MLSKIMVAEMQPLFREILEAYLQEKEDIRLLPSARSRSDLLRKIKREQPDILLIDIFQYTEEFVLLDSLQKQYPSMKILLMTFCRDQAKIVRALNCGVAAYIAKDAEAARLPAALDAIRRGEEYCCPPVSELIWEEMEDLQMRWEEFRKIESLTKREKEVMRLIAGGLSNQRIAEELNISDKTVKNHVSALLRKMNLDDRTQAAVFFLNHG